MSTIAVVRRHRPGHDVGAGLLEPTLEEPRGQQVRRHGHRPAARRRARAVRTASATDGTGPAAYPRVTGPPHRSAEPLGHGRAVGLRPRVARPGGRQHDRHPALGAPAARSRSSTISTSRSSGPSARRREHVGTAGDGLRDVDVHVVATGEQQRHDDPGHAIPPTGSPATTSATLGPVHVDVGLEHLDARAAARRPPRRPCAPSRARVGRGCRARTARGCRHAGRHGGPGVSGERSA